jgi:hypothetical protein
MDNRLTDQQITFFRAFGYLHFPGLLNDRISAIIDEFEAVFAQRGGGHNGRPHEGKARSCIVPFIDQSEALSSLLDDPRILAIATSLCGDDFAYTGSDGNYYVGDTGWHSDAMSLQHPYVKIALYLDPLTRDTGALRVIPGSHLFGDRFTDQVHRQIGRSDEFWGIGGPAVPAVALETQPGDVVCFNQNLKHASFGGGQWRRMFTINLTSRFDEDRKEDMHNYISSFARFWVDRVYGDAMVRTASPQRMKHLEQIMANDGFLAELSRKAREEMPEPSRG